MKKILVITGSHRSKQVSYSLAKKFSNKINKIGMAQVEICELASMNIQPCCATAACSATKDKRCVNRSDDFYSIFDKLAKSDAMLFIVPKYAPYPSRFLALTERLVAISWWNYTALGKLDDFLLTGKPACLISFAATQDVKPEVFHPLFRSFSSIGFDLLRSNNVEGVYLNANGKSETETMEKLVMLFSDRLENNKTSWRI